MLSRYAVSFFLLLPLSRAAVPQLSVRDADVVLVGDIIANQTTDTGASLRCQVSVLVDGVLKGDLAPSQTISLNWQFEPAPNQGPVINPEPLHTRALFFLHKSTQPGSAYQVIRAGNFTQPFGGYFVPVPSAPLPVPFRYSGTSALDAKLAGELGASLEALATKDGDTLDRQYAPPPFGGAASVPRASPEDVDQFQSLCFLFSGLNAAAAADVVHYFAISPLPNLQAIGLVGELRLKEASAILALQNNREALGRTQRVSEFAYAAMQLDIHDKPDELEALGRMAIAETAWFGFDSMVVETLARADGSVALPYLKVMLDNPQPAVRTTALRGICSKFQEGPCSSPSPTPSASDAQQAQAVKVWFAVHHPELSSLKAPSWYNTPAPAKPEEIAVTPERHRQIAFHILLARVAGHSPAAAASLHMTADNQQTFTAIATRASELLLANDEQLNKANGAARLANRGPDQAALCRHTAEFDRILNDGLYELQSALSPAARDVLGSYLDRRPVHQYAAPVKAGQWFSAGSNPPAACANSH